MFEKKINFWRLSFIFAGFTIIVLFLLWNSPKPPKATMMDGSMGNMMKKMHLNNLTIDSLTGSGSNQGQMKENMNEMHSHHQNQEPIIYKLNFASTALIFFLLPFIVGGSIILAIVWIK